MQHIPKTEVFAAGATQMETVTPQERGFSEELHYVVEIVRVQEETD